MVGLAFNLPWLVGAVWWISLPLGIAGAVLGFFAVATGIRTACPICGRRASWIYSRRFLGIECDHCGIYGGYPLVHIAPFKVAEVNPSQDCDSADPFNE
jgi:hypothetical protein